MLHTKTGRMWLPDALRGLALLNMLVYHGDVRLGVCVRPSPAAGTTSGRWDAMCGSNISVGVSSCCREFSFCRWPAASPNNGLLVAACAAWSSPPSTGAGSCRRRAILVRGAAPERLRRAADLPCCARLLAAHPRRCGAWRQSAALFCAHESAALRTYLGFERSALWLPCLRGLYKANLFWLGLPDLTRFCLGGLFPDPAVGVSVLVRYWVGVLARLLAPGQGTEPPAGAAARCAPSGSSTLPVYMLHQPVLYGLLWVGHAVAGRL